MSILRSLLSGYFFVNLREIERYQYEECLFCGERVLSPEVAKGLFEKIKNKNYVKKTVRVPVLEGAYG